MSSSKLSLELLRCLIAVFHERSVTLASEQLGLSQSTVSTALAKLRAIYADPLFVPGRRSLEPTSKAHELVEFLGPAVQLIDQSIVPRTTFQPQTASALVQIAMVDLVQDRLLPPLTRLISAEAPGVRLSVTPLALDTVEENLASQKLDLAIASNRLSLKKLRYSQLYEEKFISILRPDHPAAKGRWTAASFTRLKHIQVSPSGSDYIGIVDRALAEKGLKRNIVLFMPNYRLAASMVATSDLVALMPMGIATDMARKNGLRLKEPPLPLPRLPIIQMWHERSHRDPLHRWLRHRLVRIGGATAS